MLRETDKRGQKSDSWDASGVSTIMLKYLAPLTNECSLDVRDVLKCLSASERI